jgi:hypothetical protein
MSPYSRPTAGRKGQEDQGIQKDWNRREQICITRRRTLTIVTTTAVIAASRETE